MTEDIHGAENTRSTARRQPRSTAAAIWTAGWRLAFRNDEPKGLDSGRLRPPFGFPAEQAGWLSRPNLSEA